MKNLNEAIADLKTTIEVDGFEDDTVQNVAEEWELNPVLLDRKFKEKYGVEPAAWTAPAPVAEIDYKARYEAGMRREWKSHPKMFWDDLTPKEQKETKIFLERHIAVDNLHITWSKVK